MAFFPFRFCPSCGREGIALRRGHEFRCQGCGFVYYHNVASAVGAIIRHADSILCLVRAKEPGRGLLGLPGGFVDPHESAEDALVRECREEVSIEIEDPRFFRSYPNDYVFAGVPYVTCDLFFTAAAAPGCARDGDGRPLATPDPSETASARWIDIAALDMGEFAFPSMRRAIGDWIASPRFNDSTRPTG